MASGRSDSQDTELQDHISAVVMHLLKTHGMSKTDLATVMRIHASSLCRSLQSSPTRQREWKARDLLRMKNYFGVSADIFLPDEVDAVSIFPSGRIILAEFKPDSRRSRFDVDDGDAQRPRETGSNGRRNVTSLS